MFRQLTFSFLFVKMKLEYIIIIIIFNNWRLFFKHVPQILVLRYCSIPLAMRQYLQNQQSHGYGQRRRIGVAGWKKNWDPPTQAKLKVLWLLFTWKTCYCLLLSMKTDPAVEGQTAILYMKTHQSPRIKDVPSAWQTMRPFLKIPIFLKSKPPTPSPPLPSILLLSVIICLSLGDEEGK